MPAATAELGLPGRRVPAVVLRASHPRREWLGPSGRIEDRLGGNGDSDGVCLGGGGGIRRRRGL